MRTIRVACLILLTLVATTLPTSAWAAPVARAKTSPVNKAPSSSNAPRTERKSSSKDSKRAKLKIAPNTEMWDGTSARAAGTSPGPVAVETLMASDVACWLTVPQPNRWLRVDDSAPRADLRTPWLIGHYANAPPLSA